MIYVIHAEIYAKLSIVRDKKNDAIRSISSEEERTKDATHSVRSRYCNLSIFREIPPSHRRFWLLLCARYLVLPDPSGGINRPGYWIAGAQIFAFAAQGRNPCRWP